MMNDFTQGAGAASPAMLQKLALMQMGMAAPPTSPYSAPREAMDALASSGSQEAGEASQGGIPPEVVAFLQDNVPNAQAILDEIQRSMLEREEAGDRSPGKARTP